MERAYYLSFLDRDVTGRSGEEESLRTTPPFSLAVKHAIDSTFKERRAGTPEASKAVSGEAVDAADGSEDGESPISDRLGPQYPGRTLPRLYFPSMHCWGSCRQARPDQSSRTHYAERPCPKLCLHLRLVGKWKGLHTEWFPREPPIVGRAH